MIRLRLIAVLSSFALIFFTSCKEQQKKVTFESVVDSIRLYAQKSCLVDPVTILAYHDDFTSTAIGKRLTRSVFETMVGGSKRGLIVTDGNEIYGIDLARMDTALVLLGRGIIFKGNLETKVLTYSSVSRLSAEKGNGVPQEELLIRLSCSEEARLFYSINGSYNAQQLVYFFKLAILLAKEGNH